MCLHFHDEIKMREHFFFRMRLLLDILSNQIKEAREIFFEMLGDLFFCMNDIVIDCRDIILTSSLRF